MEILRTERLVLSAPNPADVPAITAACQDPQIQRWTTIPSPYDRSHAEGFIEMVAAGWESGASPTWALRPAPEVGPGEAAAQGPTGQGPTVQGAAAGLVGMIGLMDEGAGAAELGFWLTPDMRGLGLMDEAVAAVRAYGLEKMALARITWRARVGNFGSAQVARRAGFRYEGRLRLGLDQRGTRRDGWVAGLLATDGPFTRGAIAAAARTWPPETFR